jgi:O-antigen/teichoic acid export membrane protein
MFNVGLSLSTMGSQAATLLTGGLVPHFAGLAGTGDLAAMRRTYSSLTRLVALVVFPAAFGFAALAPALIPLLYGRSFEEAVPTAAILALLASLSAANVGSALVYGREKSAFIAVSGALGAALAIVGGLTLVPAWGSLGAAASRAVVQLCMVGLGTWYIRTRLDCPFPWHAIARTATASALAGLPGYAIVHVRSDLPGLTAACFAIAMSYAVLVRTLGLFRSEDVAIIHRILGALPDQFARPMTAAARWLAGLTYAHADYVSVQ